MRRRARRGRRGDRRRRALGLGPRRRRHGSVVRIDPASGSVTARYRLSAHPCRGRRRPAGLGRRLPPEHALAHRSAYRRGHQHRGDRQSPRARDPRRARVRRQRRPVVPRRQRHPLRRADRQPDRQRRRRALQRRRRRRRRLRLRLSQRRPPEHGPRQAAGGCTGAPIPLPAPPTAEHFRTTLFGLAVGEGAVWAIGDALDHRLFKIAPRSGRLLATFPLPIAPQRIAAGAGAVWITDAIHDVLVKLDPAQRPRLQRIATCARGRRRRRRRGRRLGRDRHRRAGRAHRSRERPHRRAHRRRPGAARGRGGPERHLGDARCDLALRRRAGTRALRCAAAAAGCGDSSRRSVQDRRPGRLHRHQRRVARLVARRRGVAAAAARRATRRQGPGGRRARRDGRRPPHRDRRGLLRDGHLRPADHRDPPARRDRPRRRRRRRVRLVGRDGLPRARPALSHGALPGRRLVRARGDGARPGAQPLPLQPDIEQEHGRARNLRLPDARVANAPPPWPSTRPTAGAGPAASRPSSARSAAACNGSGRRRSRAGRRSCAGSGLGRRRHRARALRIRQPGSFIRAYVARHPDAARSLLLGALAVRTRRAGRAMRRSGRDCAASSARLAGFPDPSSRRDAAYRKAFAAGVSGAAAERGGQPLGLPYYTAVEALRAVAREDARRARRGSRRVARGARLAPARHAGGPRAARPQPPGRSCRRRSSTSTARARARLLPAGAPDPRSRRDARRPARAGRRTEPRQHRLPARDAAALGALSVSSPAAESSR